MPSSWIYTKATDSVPRQALVQFFTGSAVFVLFVLLQAYLLRFLCIAVFWLCAVLQKRRIRIGYFCVVFLAVLLAHALVPNGTVLFYIYSFPVTLGAIEQGIHRGQTFVAMVFFSVASIHRGIVLPGTFGKLFVQMLVYFELLFQKRKSMKLQNLKNIGKELSSHLHAVYHASTVSHDSKHTQPFSLLFCIVWLLSVILISIVDRGFTTLW